MSYDLGDATDERSAKALEAQASDLDRAAAPLEAVQPAAANALRTQAFGMRQQAAAFRVVSGLPPAGAWSTGAKVGAACGVVLAAAGLVWLGRNMRN